MLDAQEIRRRWSDKTNAVFGRNDYHDSYQYGPSNQELELDFQDCRSIVFMDGEGSRGGEDLLLMARGSGHVTLPKGVQVRVVSGKVKLHVSDGDSADAGSSVVSASYGGRAPPPTRATSYAGSSASSAYRSAAATPSHAGSASTFRPSPPRDSAGFSRAGSHVGTLANARRVPLPDSNAGVDEWEVVDEVKGDWDMDNRSVAPSESVSSVGERNRRSQYQDYY